MNQVPAGLDAALALMRQGQPAQAGEACRRLLAMDPRNFGARHLLGVTLLMQGDAAQAEQEIARAIAIDQTVAGAYYNRGNALLALGRMDEAIASYDDALRRKPDFVEALRNRSDALARLGRQAESLASIDRLLALDPSNVGTWNGRAGALFALGRYDEALASYGRALSLSPRTAALHDNAGLTLQQLGRIEEALAAHDRAIALEPAFATAFVRRAMALRQLGRFEDALRDAGRAVALDAQSALAHNAHGIVLNDLGRYDEALDAYRKALALAPAFAEAHNNLGNALHDLGRFDEALDALQQAITLRPDYAEAHGNRGLVLQETHRFEEAAKEYDIAIASRPNYAEGYKRRASLRLLRGDYANGWADYDASLKHSRRPGAGPLRNIPYWNGESLRGKSLLLSEPNGIGDALQFWRFIPELIAMGADVAFLGRASLFRLLRSSPWPVRLYSEVPADVRFDYRTELWGLPRLLRTGLADIPGGVPYFAAEPERIARWTPLVEAGAVNIGIAWQGNPSRKIDVGRSIPLVEFGALCDAPGVRLVSLQRTHGLEQLRALPQGMRVVEPGEDFDAGPDAFVDTAALMSRLDLVVCSDSAVAHLAGALGVPTWLGVKWVPEWRWMLDRDDSPWYPTMRLFRQRTAGDWSGVFAAMREALLRRG
jgi:tetratricopeptide (TPR) repeat protein